MIFIALNINPYVISGSFGCRAQLFLDSPLRAD